MTNEELVKKIRAGRAELAAVLLEQNHGIMARIANRYLFLAVRNRAADFEDLMQEAAIGVLMAVDAWDEERGPFLPLAMFYMRNAIQRALGVVGKKRIENTAPPASLCVLVDEDKETELGALLVDDNAADPQEEAEKADLRRIVREAVNDLPDDQRDVLIAHALEGVPRSVLSARTGMKESRIATMERAGKRALKQNRRLCELWQEYESACDRHVGVAQFNSTWTSATEAAVLWREWLMKNKSVY